MWFVLAGSGGGGALGLRHAAGRIVGPVAVQPDNTPLDAKSSADHPGILRDGIVNRPRLAVVHQSLGGTETTGDGILGPRSPRGFAHPLKGQNTQRGIPELVFL